jgi:hypothetical protein
MAEDVEFKCGRYSDVFSAGFAGAIPGDWPAGCPERLSATPFTV